MTDLLEKRMDKLEKELADLKRIVGGEPVSANWLGSFGTTKDDPDFAELIRLGRQYRDNQREDYDTVEKHRDADS